MDAGELLRRWEAAGGSTGEPPDGDGLFGLRLTGDAADLTGASFVGLGLALNDDLRRPADVRRASRAYAGWLPALGGGIRVADYGDVAVVKDDLAVAFMQAHERLADVVAAGAAPLVLGGDALVSVPLLQVLSGKLRGRLGVVAFTPFYEIAPEPLYAPASRWARALELGVVAPANLVLVGGRAAPTDGPARRMLDGLGATTFSLDEVLRDGMTAVAQEALELAATGTEAVYLSVDLGVLAGAADPVGLAPRELTAGVRVVASALLAAADICGSGPGMGGGDGPAVAARVAAEIVAGAAARLARPIHAPAVPGGAGATARGGSVTPQTQTPVVNTFNEWDPLEEIVVGRVDDSTLVPPWDVIMPAVVHDRTQWDFFKQHGGTPWPVDMLKRAERDLDAFIDILQQAGVTVRQPEPYPYERPLAAPDWEVASSCYALMPRDVLFVIGDQIIEAPMGWRSRATERLAYRELCKEYFRGGARWVAAPPPRLSDESYAQGFVAPEEDEPQRFISTEYEPMFDAADAIKCGRDVFIARSSCCNRFGIDWLQRHLGDEYSVHEVEIHDTHPMHLDATFYPLAPGKLLINPERVVKVPDMFEKAGWDVLVCPEPEMPESHPMYNCSRWIMMNVVMLDETRVIVSAGEKGFVRQLKEWGFEPIECPFWDFETIGGGFHCASVDIRRSGGLRSYF